MKELWTYESKYTYKLSTRARFTKMLKTSNELIAMTESAFHEVVAENRFLRNLNKDFDKIEHIEFNSIQP